MRKPRLFFSFSIFLLLIISSTISKKSNNYVLIVNSSKFWFNYRQTTNSLLLYHYLRDHGIPNENILVMNPENIACSCRNNDPGSITALDGVYEPNLYTNVEIDFRKDDVSLPNILGALRSRYDPRTPIKKRLMLNEDSKVFIYINGHGGDNYWKIQDTHAIMHYDFAKAIEELHAKKLYKDILMISDSCAAFTIFDLIKQPNLIMIGSSSEGEKSYSQGRDPKLEMSKTDMFSFDTWEYLNSYGDVASVQQLFKSYDAQRLMGNPAIRHTHPKRNPSNVYLKEYFASENVWSPELLNITNKKDPIIQKEQNYYSKILESLNKVKKQEEKIDYGKKNPIREVLEDAPLNIASFSF